MLLHLWTQNYLSSFNSDSLLVKTLIALNANDVGGPNHLKRGRLNGKWKDTSKILRQLSSHGLSS